MSLNLIIPSELFSPPTPFNQPKKDLPGPIGWWHVTIEGKSIQNLGIHYGHVLEIAFGIKEDACWQYEFNPHSAPVPSTIPVWEAKRKWCRISLGSPFNVTGLQGKDRQKWFQTWLDCDQVRVTTETTYSGIKIFLNNPQNENYNRISFCGMLGTIEKEMALLGSSKKEVRILLDNGRQKIVKEDDPRIMRL